MDEGKKTHQRVVCCSQTYPSLIQHILNCTCVSVLQPINCWQSRQMVRWTRGMQWFIHLLFIKDKALSIRLWKLYVLISNWTFCSAFNWNAISLCPKVFSFHLHWGISYEYNLYLFNLGFHCCPLLCMICIILCAGPWNLNFPQDNECYCIHGK